MFISMVVRVEVLKEIRYLVWNLWGNVFNKGKVMVLMKFRKGYLGKVGSRFNEIEVVGLMGSR